MFVETSGAVGAAPKAPRSTLFPSCGSVFLSTRVYLVAQDGCWRITITFAFPSGEGNVAREGVALLGKGQTQKLLTALHSHPVGQNLVM